MALDLFDIKSGDSKFNNTKAENLLSNYASEGSSVMQCLFVEYWNPDNLSDRDKLTWEQYLRSASDSEIPYCMELSALYFEKTDSAKKLYLEVQAESEGILELNLGWHIDITNQKGLCQTLSNPIAGFKSIKIQYKNITAHQRHIKILSTFIDRVTDQTKFKTFHMSYATNSIQKVVKIKKIWILKSGKRN